jgi:hypothetical protein
MTTTRLTAAERLVFKSPTTRYQIRAEWRTEPGLGTLDERLGIIVRRLGGSTGTVRASDSERRDLAYWLAENGLAS